MKSSVRSRQPGDVPDGSAPEVNHLSVWCCGSTIDVDLGDKRRLTVQLRADAPVLEDEAVHVGIDPDDEHVFEVAFDSAETRGGAGVRSRAAPVHAEFGDGYRPGEEVEDAEVVGAEALEVDG
jgi:hypothetical protein